MFVVVVEEEGMLDNVMDESDGGGEVWRASRGAIRLMEGGRENCCINEAVILLLCLTCVYTYSQRRKQYNNNASVLGAQLLLDVGDMIRCTTGSFP